MSARILTMAALLASIALRPAVAQGTTNFSGTWKMNTEKSDPMGGGAPNAGMGMGTAVTVITQAGGKLTVERKFGDQSQVSTYNLDGSPSTNTTQRGDATSKAHWDGAALVIETTSASGMTSKLTYTLSADGKTLTSVSVRQGQNGETTRKTVYDKQ